MTQKEKAIEYDKAIERAKKILEREDAFVRVTPMLMHEIFPKLAESEDKYD